jgi:hypothetical protein
MADKPRLLFYDIETSLQLVTVFDLKYNDFIDPSNIVLERHMLSACWKWSDEKKVHSVSLLDDPKRFEKDIHDDRHVVTTIHDVLSEADVVVGHNSDSFDNKYVETRALFHGLKPLPPLNTIDTYKIAKSRFRFNSNKLDYLGQFLGLGKKIKTSPGLWSRVLKGDKKAIKEMVTYNIQDVLLLEKVFDKLRPYASTHMNRELFGGTGCPRCGSTDVQRRGLHRAISNVYQRWQCQSCAGWFKTAKAEKNVKATKRVL